METICSQRPWKCESYYWPSNVTIHVTNGSGSKQCIVDTSMSFKIIRISCVFMKMKIMFGISCPVTKLPFIKLHVEHDNNKS